VPSFSSCWPAAGAVDSEDSVTANAVRERLNIRTANPDVIAYPENMPFPEILVVDDEPANLQVVRRFLQDTRYVVTTAGSADEALNAIDAHGPFDVYVLDVMMPEVRGTELADTIRAQQPEALVLYFTGYSDALFSGTRKLRDGEAFIQKPVTKRDVLEAISLLLYKDLRGPRE